ncbi:CLUMA_CG004632, isoform A [Clunio marinus]|uniref:Galectin n=1 Tax=Clunio marinus TaxID=568069 RepID=A0A1J1HSB3_9DIPT|nr:CLUMA_CG004631, isoform A [Clunio marinus]CRK90943.1 CLUMA_CG004632, isoform A [Clunio marinus]
MVKFTGYFHNNLEFGHVVILGGKIRETAGNFTLNLLSEDDSLDVPRNIPFHMNVVFGENGQIIRNTKIHGEFGAAENASGMFTNLVHDVEKVTQFDHRKVFPFSYPVYQTRLLPNLRFSNDVPTPFCQGNVIVLKGSAGGNPNGSFTLKFLVGKTEMQSFHMDVRFSVKKVFRTNSVNDNVVLNLADAETYGGFPFEFEKIFKIALGFESNGIRVSVNGSFFCEYPYTTRLTSYSGLKIREKNDLVLHILEIQHFTVDKDLRNMDLLSRLQKR